MRPQRNRWTVARYAIFELPKAVAEHRARRDQSLRDASKEIGVGARILMDFEKGKSDPKLSTVMKYLDYLDT